MKVRTKDQLLEFLRQSGPSSPSKLSEYLQISPQAVHRHLKDLISSSLICKRGSAPHVFYELYSDTPKPQFNHKTTPPQREYIEHNFSRLLPNGHLITGIQAFESWLESTKQIKSYDTLVESYIKLHKEIYTSKNNWGLFDLTKKVQETFKDCYLDKVLCCDFYSLPQFGKTYLGNLITAGKSGQNKPSINRIAELTGENLRHLIQQEKITALAWVPHSIPRKTLFLPYLKKLLDLELPEIKLIKTYSGGIPVAQKSLSKLEDRVTNARETILIKSAPTRTNKVLIIDDALGSGATMNEIAHKIRDKTQAKNIVGYAVVGSFKGFDVLGVV